MVCGTSVPARLGGMFKAPRQQVMPVAPGLAISVPVRYVVASGTSFGSHGDEQEQIRVGLDAATARAIHLEQDMSAPASGYTEYVPGRRPGPLHRGAVRISALSHSVALSVVTVYDVTRGGCGGGGRGAYG
jgi:hypothetical protein